MNANTMLKLVELNIFDSREISEQEYVMLKNNNTNPSLIYVCGHKDDECYMSFMEINTNGLSLEDVKLMLEIEQVEETKSIKKMVQFFYVMAIIGTVISLGMIFFYIVLLLAGATQ